MNLTKSIEAIKRNTPKTGFNLVGVDTYEMPGEELYFISHHKTEAEANAAKASRDKDEICHIYGATSSVTKSNPFRQASELLK